MASKVFVVGSGVVGLRTSLELIRRKIPVVLRSPVPPTDARVCSQGAGGFWMPFHCDDSRTDRWATETLDELHTIMNQSKGSSSLIESMHAVVLQQDHEGPTTEDFIAEDYKDGTGGNSPIPPWTTDPRLKFQHVTTEMLWWQNSIFKLRIPTETTLLEQGYKHAWFFQTPVVDSPKMLQHMLQELQDDPLADVDVETEHYYGSLDEIVEDAKSAGCDKALNATGLGSSSICSDESMIGARGILLHYDRNDCPRIPDIHETEHGEMQNDAVICVQGGPWGSETYPSYLIPRGDIIVAGGSYLEGDTETEIRKDERQQLLQNARRLGIDTEKVQPTGEWVGYRPYRPTSRLEVDSGYSSNDFTLVHSYGYGGSGWTVYVGCAKEATELLVGS